MKKEGSDNQEDEKTRQTDVRPSFDEEEMKEMQNFEMILKNNKKWAADMVQKDPNYFKSLVAVQKPKFLWLGCADSRVPANQIIGLKPGQVFVHRNIANIIPPSDINALSVVQYAVQHLKVQDIIVCGHYRCGGIKAAFSQTDFGPLEAWLSHLRELRSKNANMLIGEQKKKEERLVEINVKQQVINVAKLSVVQKAWKEKRKLIVHGLVYSLKDGILKDLGITLYNIEHIPLQFRIVQ